MKIKSIIPYAVSFVSGAAVSAVVTSMLWDNKDRQRMQKELDETIALKEKIERFGDPKVEGIDRFTANALLCIADKINEYPSCGYIYFSRKCAAVVLRRIAECMNEGETLIEFESKQGADR